MQRLLLLLRESAATVHVGSARNRLLRASPVVLASLLRFLPQMPRHKAVAPSPHLPPLPPVSLTPQTPVDPDAGFRFWRSIGSPSHVVAPLVNQSELPFRLLCRHFGAQLTYTPMLHSVLFSSSPQYRATHFHTSPLDRPLIAQFCGDDPLTLLQAARHIEGQVDAVDLNLGCPQGIARRGHYGAFLLSELPLLRSIVATLHDHLSIPVTCKVRLLPSLDDTLTLVRTLEAAGCAVLTVHGRTKEAIKDRVGAADWDAIRAIKAALRIPVIANGSVATHADVQRCLAYTGVDAVMSGEAILATPHLFSPAAATAAPTPFALARQYLALCKAHPHPPTVVRPHLFKLLFQPLSVHVDVREKMGKCQRAELEGIVDELEAADGALRGEERERRYEGKVGWYSRHLTYKKVAAAAVVEKGEEDEAKEGKKRAREDGDEEKDFGECRVMEAGDGEKRRRETDREVVVTDRIIEAEQKRQDVENGDASIALQAEREGWQRPSSAGTTVTNAHLRSSLLVAALDWAIIDVLQYPVSMQCAPPPAQR